MTDIVLIGGGHSHVAVLRRFAMAPMAGVRLTLISRGVDTPYSGMLPGLIAGHYSYDDAHIDLQRLTRFANARAYFAEAAGVDPARRLVSCEGRPPVPYDILSINVGSTPNVSVPGAAEHAIPVKPIDRFLDRWDALQRRLADASPRRIAVVGGGAGGVELLLSAQFALQRHEFHLFSAAPDLLPTHNARVRRAFERILRERGAHVHLSCPISRVAAGTLHAEGKTFEVDEILWTTEARAAAWIRQAGFETDDEGFMRVHDTLESVSHANVFAAGDVASLVGHRLEKSGVFAVREGRVLADNLRRAVRREALERYRPQRRFLSLVTTGSRYAVASRGALAFEGAWVWRWKDRIDRRFMRMYQDPRYESMRGGPAGPADHMRCGGCGAKVGPEILSRALARLGRARGPGVLVGLDAPDDGAVVEVPACKVLVQSVDFLRMLIDDPYTFGRIAANHALGDLYAMGAEPHTALAVVNLPHGPDADVEDTLTQLMAGALRVFDAAGATLVGGHTSEAAELGLGFTVNGLADRGRILRKGGLRPGDRLILTKAIGTGTIFAADMRARAKGRWVAGAVASMTQSSGEAAACLLRAGASACTDVTGFGLAGHAHEMAEASGVDIEIDLAALPVLDGAEDTVRAGVLSTLHPQNVRLRRVIRDCARVESHPRFPLLFDPQTAGGLLAGVPPDAADPCVAALREAGYASALVIGQVLPHGDSGGRIRIRS